ncbi:MAG: MFS transporter [Clostridiales bacterium]|nr:MFS transporter [Clostridiales bacterium]
MKKFLLKHLLFKTLVDLKGNPRVCVYTEPMWGLSVNLCLPYATVFMLALGLSDTQVGLVTSIYMFSQMIFAFLSGAIVDKLGRRKSTAIFDFISWSLPCLIWAFSQGFWFFVVAALLNGTMKIPTVSWDSLLIEDAPKDQVTKIYSWITIATNFSALFAPISSIMVSRLTLVPAIRILYINAFVVMTIKTFLLFRFSTETKVGRIKQEQTHDKSLGQLLYSYKGALGKIFKSRATKFAIVISILVEIVTMIGTTFWQVISSRRIGIPDTLLPIFPMFKSILTFIIFFTLITKIDQKRLKRPLLVGFISALIAYLVLISIKGTGVWGYILLTVSLAFEALGMALLGTLRGSLVAINVDPMERSSILAILQTTVMLVSVPFGYIAGSLSDISRTLPFILGIGLLILGILATLWYYGSRDKSAKVDGNYSAKEETYEGL